MAGDRDAPERRLAGKVYEVTEPGWLAPGWYVLGLEYLGPFDSKAEAEEELNARASPPEGDTR